MIFGNKLEKRWKKFEMILSPIPNSSVEKYWPSDSPNYHTINTK